MTRRGLLGLLRLLLAVAVLLPSFTFKAQAQSAVPEDQRLGKKTEYDSMPFLQVQPPAAEEAPQAVTEAQLPGTRVVFESYRDSNYEIYIADDDGGNLLRLTNNSNIDIEPRLARGGSKIAFASDRFSGQLDVLTMNLDGSGVTRLTTAAQDDRDPVWSPDGSKILFQSKRDGNWEIYLMDANGLNQTRLTNNPDDDITPNWSPDGSKIVWSSYQNGGYRIWVMNADGGGAQQLSQQAYSENPAWSPDGSKIAFDADSNGDGYQEIWVMNADGSNPVMLSFYGSTQGTVDYLARGWSPNSSWITFTSVVYTLYKGTWYITNAALLYTAVIYPTPESLFPGGASVDFLPDWQTLDITPPSSSVNPLPAQSPNPFVVSWGGVDTGPSGIKNYDIQVRYGLNGTWETWLDGTPSTSAEFRGGSGQTYYFRSRARDRCCNVEAWPEDYDTFTTIENLPPVSKVNPLPELSPASFVVSWGGYDPGGSGIDLYSVQYKVDGGSWDSWLNSVGWTSALFTANPGHTYAFRSCAEDWAGNQEIWPVDGLSEAQTTAVSFGLTGKVIDNSGNPVAGALVFPSLSPFQNSPSQVDGSYRTLVATDSSSITLNWEKPGYGTLPTTNFSPLPLIGKLDVSLPPIDNVIANPGLEDSGFATQPWSIGGSIPPAVEDNTSHTGKSSISLGVPGTFTEVTPISFAAPGILGPGLYHVTEPNGTIHLIWTGGTDFHSNLFYARRSADGVWSAPYEIVHDDNLGGGALVVIGSDGTVYVVWCRLILSNSIIMAAQRSPSGVWSAPVAISPEISSPDVRMAVDSRGVVSVAWNVVNWSAGNSSLYFTQRSSGGTWSNPAEISLDNTSNQIFVGVNSSDTLYIMWHNAANEIVYRCLPADGTWSDKRKINAGAQNLLFRAEIDRAGKIQIITLVGTPYKLYSLQLNGDGSLSAPAFVADLQQNPGVVAILSDKNNGIHVFWYDQGAPYHINYAFKPFGGAWSAPQIASDEYSMKSHLSMVVDVYGNPVVAWERQEGTGEWPWVVMYTRKLADGWTKPEQITTPQNVQYEGDLSLSADDQGWINLTWSDRGGGKAYFSSLMETVGPAGGTSDLSQVVTLTPTMTAPVLSFFYQLNNAAQDNAAHFDVSVIHGTETTLLYSTTASTTGWVHHWLDVSQWIGQEITVSFKLYLAAGKSTAYALIDDVSIGSTSPDVWAGSYVASQTLPGSSVVQHLVYGNRGGPPANGVTLTATLPAGLTFVSAEPAPTTVNGQTLTWEIGDLAGRSGPFTIQVTSTLANDVACFSTLEGSIQVETTSSELESANNTAPIRVYVGTRMYYMPTITK